MRLAEVAIFETNPKRCGFLNCSSLDTGNFS
jgi:hypothetical protein